MRRSSSLLSIFSMLTCAVLPLTACSPATPPTPSPAILTMNYTPALRPFGPVFQTCAHLQPGLNLLVNELSSSRIDTLPADVILTWGEASVAGRVPYQTGSEELVFIVNPANPVTLLSADQLKALLSGQSAAWGAVLQPACADCTADAPDHPFTDKAVALWTYPGGDEADAALAQFPGGTLIPSFQAHLAPDPQAMRLAVSQDPAALGFIPRRWLDASVKILEVRGLTAGMGQRPILAYPLEPVSPTASAFIACLQQVLNP